MVIGNPILLSGGSPLRPEDEGKVVYNGALVSQTSTTVTADGTYDTTLNDEVVVEVLGNEYTYAQTMTLLGDGGNTLLLNKSVSANGTYDAGDDDVLAYKTVTVAVTLPSASGNSF